MLEQKLIFNQMSKTLMPKVQGVDGNDDDDDVAEKIH